MPASSSSRSAEIASLVASLRSGAITKTELFQSLSALGGDVPAAAAATSPQRASRPAPAPAPQPRGGPMSESAKRTLVDRLLADKYSPSAPSPGATPAVQSSAAASAPHGMMTTDERQALLSTLLQPSGGEDAPPPPPLAATAAPADPSPEESKVVYSGEVRSQSAAHPPPPPPLTLKPLLRSTPPGARSPPTRP